MTKRNPPSRTTIRGQRHLLAYITPAEAELLKSRGGTGEFHKGVPSYPPGFGGESSGFGSERAGGAAGGPSGASGGGGRSSSDPGGGGPGGSGGRSGSGDHSGGRESASASDRGAVDNRQRSEAQKQIDKQIALGKKNIENMSTTDKIMAAVMPFAGINVAQNYAAQFMGNRMKDVLSKEGSRAVYDSRTGRVSGVYDSLGRLTGRDPEAEARAEREQIGSDRGPLPIIKKEEEEEQSTLGKKVIRSDLTKEIEAERIRRSKAGMRQLGNRTLLSSNSTLGV